MSVQVNQKGQFRGSIVEYTLHEFPKGNVCVGIRAILDEIYDFTAEQWVDWREHDVEANGLLTIIKLDGTASQIHVDALCKYAGWDGTFQSIEGGNWRPTPCQFSIDEDKYDKRKHDFTISFVNDYDRTPGQPGVNAEKAKSLDATHGSKLRAIVGNAKRNAPVANGSKPPTPPARKETQAPKKQPESEPSSFEDSVPF